MRLLCLSLAISASLVTGLRPAQADTASIFNKSIHDDHMAPAAKESLDALVKMYDARDKLKACHMEYVFSRRPDNSDAVTVVGDLQKPNRMNLRLYQGSKFLGQAVNDGTTETFYNAVTNKYAQCAAPQSYDMRPEFLEQSSSMVPGTNESVETYHLAGLSPQEKANNYAEGVLIEGAHVSLNEALNGAQFLLCTTTPLEAEGVATFFGKDSRAEMKRANASQPFSTVTLIMPINDTSTYSDNGYTSWQLQFTIANGSSLPIYNCDVLKSRNDTSKPDDTIVMNHFDHMAIKPAKSPFHPSAFVWAPPAKAKPYTGPLSQPDQKQMGPLRLIDHIK